MSRAVLIEMNPGQGRILTGGVPADMLSKISDVCAFEVQGHEHMKLFKEGKWDGKRRLFNRQTRTFPPGLADRICAVLTEEGYTITFQWSDIETSKINLKTPDPEWLPRVYQHEAIVDAIHAGGGIVQVATGGGKTVIAGWIINYYSESTVFLVHTKDLLYQAKSLFTEMFGAQSIGQIGDGVVDPRDITICTLQTAARALGVEYQRDDFADGEDSWADEESAEYGDLDSARIVGCLRSANLAIVDECHRVAAPTALEVMASLRNANHMYGLSASPWRDDGADLALEGALGPKIVEIGASELIRLEHLVQPVIRMVEVPNKVYPKGTKYSAIYQDYVVDNDTRNTAGVAAACGMVRRGLPTLVLVRQIEHGNRIAKMLTEALGYEVPFISGEDSSGVRGGAIAAARSGSLPCFVASTIADEGLDIKRLSGLVLLGGGKSSVRALQRVGRVLRPFEGKKHAEVVDFVDRARYLIDHSAARQAMYENEPEFIVTDV